VAEVTQGQSLKILNFTTFSIRATAASQGPACVFKDLRQFAQRCLHLMDFIVSGKPKEFGPDK